MTKICPECRTIAMDHEKTCSVCKSVKKLVVLLVDYNTWWNENKDKR